MTEVYVNGRLLELGNIKIQKVFQINDIGEPKDRQLDYTLPFDIPETPNNLITLEMLGLVGSSSRVPYKQIKAKVKENSVELIPDGILVVTKKQGKFKAYIYAGNFFLFDKIGSKKMNELDYSNLNHVVNLDNFVNSFTNTQGYIYAIADFGKFDDVDIEINYQVPSIYTHTLWRMIFEQSNIKYYGDIFETDKFKSKLTTTNRGYNSDIDDITGTVNVTTDSYEFTSNIQLSTVINNGINFPIYYSVQNNVEPIEDFAGNPAPVGYIISIEDTTSYNYEFDLELANGNGNLQFIVHLVIEELGSGNFVKNEYLTSINLNQTVALNIVDSAVLEKGKHYAFYIKYFYGNITGTSYPFENTTTFTVTNFSLQNGQSVTSLVFNNFIGDMSQIDFVKDVMQEFGLIFKKRKNELAYDFIQIKKLLSDRTNTLDWSDKYIREISQDYKLSSYARSNRFAYNYLESDGDRFADGILRIENENLPSEKTLVTRPYNAPELSGFALSNNYLLHIPFWKLELNDDGSVKGHKPFQSKNYVAEIKYVNTTINYKLMNGDSIPFTGEVPILDFSQLSYSQILNENYKELKRTLDFNQVKTVDLLLNEKDIQDLDLFKTIFLKQFSSDFIINKIKYTNSSKASKADLVMINRMAIESFTPPDPPDPTNPLITIDTVKQFRRDLGTPNYYWDIITTYTIEDIEIIDAEIVLTQLTASLANGGVPTGYSENASINNNSGTHYFTFSEPLNMREGWYSVQISDNSGVVSNIEDIELVDRPPATPPIANAGADITATVPSTMPNLDVTAMLDGSLSTTENGSIMYYTWRIISGTGGAIQNNFGATNSYAYYLSEGIYVVELTVENSYGLTDTDTVTITVPSSVEVNCDETFAPQGDVGLYEFEINFGTNTGLAGIHYNAYSVPDRFIIEWDGNTYDSGYVGESYFDNQLIATGVDPADINTGVPSTGKGVLTFNKTSALPSTAKITVIAPLGGTAWRISGICPTE